MNLVIVRGVRPQPERTGSVRLQPDRDGPSKGGRYRDFSSGLLRHNLRNVCYRRDHVTKMSEQRQPNDAQLWVVGHNQHLVKISRDRRTKLRHSLQRVDVSAFIRGCMHHELSVRHSSY